MNEIKLKPCPFCGGEAVMYHQSSKYTDYDGDYVYCMDCGCRTKLFECFNGTGKTHDDTEREAMKAWNGRLERTGVWLDLPDYINGWYRNGQHWTMVVFAPIGTFIAAVLLIGFVHLVVWLIK